MWLSSPLKAIIVSYYPQVCGGRVPLGRPGRRVRKGPWAEELRQPPVPSSGQVSDLRNQVYLENGLDPFPGEGRVVGWQKMRKASDRAEKQQGELSQGLGAVREQLQVAAASSTRSPSLAQQAPR